MGSVTMQAIDVASKHVVNVINSHIMFNKNSNVYGMIDQNPMIIIQLKFKMKMIQWQMPMNGITLHCK